MIHVMTESGTDVRWLDDDQQRAWRAFLEMHAKLTAQLNREMQAASGLSMPDFTVLVSLSEHPGGRMRALELARDLRWEKSRLSHQLSRMQQRGLIERSHCDEDRRGAFVELTAQGRAAVEGAAPPHVEAVRRYLFDALQPAQVAMLETISRTAIASLDSECDGKGDSACQDTAELDPSPCA
jgi:DNA-binding MarR family transcriptional regulator